MNQALKAREEEHQRQCQQIADESEKQYAEKVRELKICSKRSKLFEEERKELRPLGMQVKGREMSESEHELARNKRIAQEIITMECIQEQKEEIIRLRNRVSRNGSRSVKVRLCKPKDSRQSDKQSLDSEESRSDRTACSLR